MQEKIIIKSEPCIEQRKFGIIFKILVAIGVIGFLHSVYLGFYYSEFELFFKPGRFPDDFLTFSVISSFPIIFALLVKFWLSSYEMVVTDKRVYGKVAFGKRVDLPLDSITATAELRVFKGVAVSTASGRIRFLLVKNAHAMYEIINNLLLERQKKEAPVVTTAPANVTTPVNTQVSVNARNESPEDLIKLKALLDMGVITQEDFDAKKKQILGL